MTNTKMKYKNINLQTFENILDIYTSTICNVFEQILNEKDITIPDKCRQGDYDEARLFGDSRNKVEKQINSIIHTMLNELDNKK